MQYETYIVTADQYDYMKQRIKQMNADQVVDINLYRNLKRSIKAYEKHILSGGERAKN